MLSIDRKNKTVSVRDASDNMYLLCFLFLISRSVVPYDKLILSPGCRPFIPDINGVNAPGVFQLRDIPDSRQIKAWIESRNAKKAVIIGGGFIGLEMAESLKVKY